MKGRRTEREREGVCKREEGIGRGMGAQIKEGKIGSRRIGVQGRVEGIRTMDKGKER